MLYLLAKLIAELDHHQEQTLKTMDSDFEISKWVHNQCPSPSFLCMALMLNEKNIAQPKEQTPLFYKISKGYSYDKCILLEIDSTKSCRGNNTASTKFIPFIFLPAFFYNVSLLPIIVIICMSFLGWGRGGWASWGVRLQKCCVYIAYLTR